MAPLALDFTYAQWSAVYNALSFGIAGMEKMTKELTALASVA